MRCEAFRRPAAGHTLVELLIVVALLATIAGVAMQQAAPAAAGRLDAAAEDAAGALRFARIEAMRTRTAHGVDFSADATTGERRIRLFRVNAGTPPDAVFDVRHPVAKTVFDIGLSTQPGTQGVALVQASFHYRSGGSVITREWVAFDPTGQPQYYPDPAGYTPHEDANLVNAVTLRQAGRDRRVLLDAVTGRVRIEPTA